MGQGDGRHHVGRAVPQRKSGPGLPGWIAIALAVLLVGGILAAYTAYRDVFGEIHRVRVTGLGNRPVAYDRSLNILVIGSDTRSGGNAKFGAHIAGQRSDTVLVLHLSPGLRRAVVLSIPRDSVVPVLACPPAPGAPGQAAAPGQIEQINATFAAGGPGCLWKAIEQTTGIRLDHFIELNFTGFERVVNDLGGVSICLPYPINDPRSKLHLSAGIHHVMGPTALAYWRVRYIGEGSDLQRIQRDQYLMASVAQDVKRANLLMSPARVFKLVTDLAGALTTDAGLSQAAMIALATALRSLPLSAVDFVQVPIVFYRPNPNWVQWSPSAQQLFRAVARDRKLPRARHRKPVAGQRRGHAAATPRTGMIDDRSSSLSTLPSRFGGITASANVCHDSTAFAGPLGGH